jgi:hypothetical protein
MILLSSSTSDSGRFGMMLIWDVVPAFGFDDLMYVSLSGSSLAGIILDVERGVDHFTSCLMLGPLSDEFCKKLSVDRGYQNENICLP